MLRTLHAAATPRPVEQTRRNWIVPLIWVLFLIPAVHVWLLHNVADLHSPQGMAVQALRPLGTLGAAIVLLSVGLLSHGHRRVAWFCIAGTIFSSALYSTLKIIFDVSVTNPFMRVLWVIVYLSAFIGAITYVPPSIWSNVRKIGSTLRIVASCVTVGCAAFAILYQVYR
jgi:hypothetical protein